MGFVSETTGVVIPARCGAHTCEYCAPINAVLTARAIHHARPERLVTLTGVGFPYSVVQRRMATLLQHMRRRGFTFNATWTVEANPRETGHHLHAAQWGSYVPQGFLSEAAKSAGMGEVTWIERARTGPQGAHYGLKGALYQVKGGQDPGEELLRFLEANGGRLVHSTRGFWRDGPGGQPLQLREAQRRAAPRQEDRDPGPWRLVWMLPGGAASSAAPPSRAASTQGELSGSSPPDSG